MMRRPFDCAASRTTSIAGTLGGTALLYLLLATACGGEKSPSWSDVSDDPVLGDPATLGPDVDGPIVVGRTTSTTEDTTTDTDDETEGDTGDEPTEISLALCETAAGYSASSLEGTSVLDDFEDGDQSVFGNGRVGDWYQYGDDLGTLLPEGGGAVDGPGRAASQYALHVGGVGFSEWGSGTGVGLSYDDNGSCLHDLSAYTGVSFWAKGSVVVVDETNVVERDQGTVRLMLTEADATPVEEGGGCDGTHGGCWDTHRVRFMPDECWRLYAFDFSEFEQDGWGQDGGELNLDQIYNMNFEIAAYNDWDLWVDEIEFYAGDKPAAVEECGGDTGEGGSHAFQ